MPKVRGPSLRRRKDDRSLLDWVGGRDGATNGDEYKPKLTLRDNYPIEYSCEAAMEGRGDSISEVWFLYDYELTLNGKEDPTETRREFEWSVLWNVGVELGLYNCSLDMQDAVAANGGGRWERMLGGAAVPPTLSPLPTRVVALGNDMEDQMDVEAGTFVVFLLNHCIVSFTDLTPRYSIRSTTEDHCFENKKGCRPMKGIMNALYTGNEREAQNVVLTLIEKVMASNVVRVKGVAQVQYIGDRDEYVVPAPPNSLVGSTTTENDNPMRTFGMGIGIAVGVAIVLGLVVGMLVARFVRKRTDKRDSQTGMSVTSIEIMELDDVNPDEFKQEEEETEECNVQVVDSIEKTSTDASSDVSQVQQVDSVGPAKPQQSQSLQRRRRRKKKKKKKARMGLVRSNSVGSMDTITEANEEDERDSDDIGSDCDGSEYSTDDEDQDFPLRRTLSTGSLSTDPSFPLEQVVESPRIQKLPPPPV